MVAIAYASYVPLSLRALREDFDRRFPGRSKRSDGLIGDAAHQSRPSDHNIGANGKIHAADITNDPPVCPVHVEVRKDDIRRDPRMKYIISNAKMISSYPMGMYPAFAERPYSGSNAHRQHAHISIKSGRVYENDISSWYDRPQEEKLDAETKKKFEELDEELKAIRASLGPDYGASISKSLIKARRNEDGTFVRRQDGSIVYDEHLDVVEQKVDELAMHIGVLSEAVTALVAKSEQG